MRKPKVLILAYKAIQKAYLLMSQAVGHWQHYYPLRVGEIIDAFLMKHRVLRKELETYAVNAYTGYVL